MTEQMRPFPVTFVLAYGGSFIYFLGYISHCARADRSTGCCSTEKNVFIVAVGAFLCGIVKNGIADCRREGEEQFFTSFFWAIRISSFFQSMSENFRAATSLDLIPVK